jgi:hypothetical protein
MVLDALKRGVGGRPWLEKPPDDEAFEDCSAETLG